jgi:hypothetical protein
MMYLCLCFGAIAIILLVGFGYGEDISCNDAVNNKTQNFLTEKTIKQVSKSSIAIRMHEQYVCEVRANILSQGTLHDWRCTVTAMALYFFLMAGSLWWVMLTVSWFLEAGLKWGQEAIDAKSQIFHTIAWTVPSLMTIVVLVLKKVEGIYSGAYGMVRSFLITLYLVAGDVLSGLCFVGLWDPQSLFYFVALPLVIYLGLGTIILILGLIGLVKVRTLRKQDGPKAEIDKLNRLMMRIGEPLFTVLEVTFLIRAPFACRRVCVVVHNSGHGSGGVSLLRVCPPARLDSAVAGGDLPRSLLQGQVADAVPLPRRTPAQRGQAQVPRLSGQVLLHSHDWNHIRLLGLVRQDRLHVGLLLLKIGRASPTRRRSQITMQLTHYY